MANLIDEIIKGRKTFFIAPDRSLLPQSFLEEYLALGYECYFIDNDIFLPMENKIELILSIFKDSILFFNIDFPIQNLKWLNLISTLKIKHQNALFGVMYTKRQTPSEKLAIEHTYLYNLGLQCGCIQLEYQKKNNFGIIEKTLFANQAMGRRKNVRAVCTSSCNFSLTTEKGEVINGKLNDISISHFSFTLPIGKLDLAEYEKIKDIQFTIHGLHLRSDAVMYMKRTIATGELFVFAFTTQTGAAGLDPLNKQLLTPKLYEIMAENCNELLTKLFSAASHRRDQAITDLLPN